MTARTLEEKWNILVHHYGGIVDNPKLTQWKTLKEAFIAGQLTWDILRNTKMPALVYSIWMLYQFDIDPPYPGTPGSETLPQELFNIDAMIMHLQNL